jgi:hypothetical protein
MSTKSWPFLAADAAQGLGLGKFTHQTNIDGEIVQTPAPLPTDLAQVLQVCQDDEDLAVRVFMEGFKLRINAHVRGPLMKEMKANAERLAKRRECSLLWASQNDKDAFMLHYGNGREAYADQVFEKHRDAIRAKYPTCPA